MERFGCLAFFGRVVIWDYSIIEPLLRIVRWLTQDLIEAWCIAKIRRLVGPIEPPVGSRYEEEFALAEYLETSTFRHQDDSSERQFITVGTLRQELEKISAPEVSPELLDYIEFLLVLDHTKRPTAEEALRHPYLCND